MMPNSTRKESYLSRYVYLSTDTARPFLQCDGCKTFHHSYCQCWRTVINLVLCSGAFARKYQLFAQPCLGCCDSRVVCSVLLCTVRRYDVIKYSVDRFFFCFFFCSQGMFIVWNCFFLLLTIKRSVDLVNRIFGTVRTELQLVMLVIISNVCC